MLKSGTSSEPQVLFISYENEGPVRRLRQNGRSVCVPIFPPDLRWALIFISPASSTFNTHNVERITVAYMYSPYPIPSTILYAICCN